MPFYGRPSKNCESCRERRIKCDRRQPVCSQCRRAGKECGGYRDVLALLFRDETDRAARRSATAKSRAGERQKVGTDLCKDKILPNSWPSITWPNPPISEAAERKLITREPPALPAVVSSSADEQGLRFFFDRFTHRYNGVNSANLTEVSELPPLLQIVFDELSIRDAVVAVGLAALANIKHDRALRLASQEKYVVALRYTRQAVENPDGAHPSHTFILIMMLTLYEMTCCSNGNIDAWATHVEGAAALMQSNAFRSAFRSSHSRPNIQFFFISIIKYFLDQGSISAELRDYTHDTIISPAVDELPAVHLVDILVRFVKLHQYLRDNLNCDPDTAVQLIQGVDSEFEEWKIKLPQKWAFVLDKTDDMGSSYMGKRMGYNFSWSASDIIHYFWGRLKANEMILSYCARLESPTSMHLQQQQRAYHICEQMIAMICASVSTQMYSWTDAEPMKRTTVRSPPLNGVFTLLFPMAMAGSSAATSDETHDWIIQKLEYIGQSMGIQRAAALVPKLKSARAWNQEKLRSKQPNPPLRL